MFGAIGVRTLVTYYTESGNTKKVAEAIFGVIVGEKEIKPIGDVDAIEGYDLIFVGLWRFSQIRTTHDFS